jgi:hypothetical protein
VNSEFLNSYKIQPQDGSTKPESIDQIPVANGILQKNLNAEMLDGHIQEEFSKTTHSHTLDEILDQSPYYSILGVENNLITPESIAVNNIDFTKVDRIAFDPTIGNYYYQPIYETGIITLTQYAETTLTFERTIKNARVILQRVPLDGETVVPGAEKRTARLTEVTETGFKAKQMGSIRRFSTSSTTYYRKDSADAAANSYYYFVIGEKA